MLNDSFWVECVTVVLFGVLSNVCVSHVLNDQDKMVGVTPESNHTSYNADVPTRRAARLGSIWGNGVIPYEGKYKDRMNWYKGMFAMRHWERYTCLTFIDISQSNMERLSGRRSPHTTFIDFRDDYSIDCGCCSYVGKQGGRQVVYIKDCVIST